MKNLEFIAMASFMAFCVLVFGSESNTLAQGKSGKSKGNSSMGVRRSTEAIQSGIERITSNRSHKNRNTNRDDWDDNRQAKNSRKNRRHTSVHTNNGVRDWGRGIGRGKGQGKGRGYANKMAHRRGK